MRIALWPGTISEIARVFAEQYYNQKEAAAFCGEEVRQPQFYTDKDRIMKNRMDIKEAEDYLNGIPKFSKKTTMENERKILALLGIRSGGSVSSTWQGPTERDLCAPF